MNYPAIKSKALTGKEIIQSEDAKAISDLQSYWSWAHSNLIDNAERGALAEYLVHLAVGATASTRVNWDRYDVLSPENIAIEVKASGYIQSWAQEKLSAIQFSIRPTYGWDSETNTYSETLSRQSDIYVFCLLAHKEQETVNPLDTSQWEFYVLPTSILNEKVGNQKTITLSGVIKLGAKKTGYKELRNTILQAYWIAVRHT